MTVLHRGLALARRGWSELRSGRHWRALRHTVSRPQVAVQLTAIVIGAALAGVVAVLYSGASGAWQESIREETIRSGLRHAQVSAVYGDEAPPAFRVAAVQARADALSALAGESEAVTAERVIATQLAFTMGRNAASGPLAADRAYALPDGGFDMARRLADGVRAGPAVPDPARTAADGDAEAAFARGLSVYTVVVTGLAVVLAALPWQVRRNLRGRHRSDALDPDHASSLPEIVPQPGSTDPRNRRTAYVLLALWAAGVLLPFAQLALSSEEQRLQAAAARTGVLVTEGIAIGQARAAFADEAMRTALFADAAALARQLAALDATGPQVAVQASLVAAEEITAARVHVVAARMGAPPTVADGIDGHLADALGRVPDDWWPDQREQVGLADRAVTFGNWSNATVAVIAVVAALGAVVQVTSAARPDGPGR